MLTFASPKQAERVLGVWLQWLKSCETDIGNSPVSVGLTDLTFYIGWGGNQVKFASGRTALLPTHGMGLKPSMEPLPSRTSKRSVNHPGRIV